MWRNIRKRVGTRSTKVTTVTTFNTNEDKATAGLNAENDGSFNAVNDCTTNAPDLSNKNVTTFMANKNATEKKKEDNDVGDDGKDANEKDEGGVFLILPVLLF